MNTFFKLRNALIFAIAGLAVLFIAVGCGGDDGDEGGGTNKLNSVSIISLTTSISASGTTTLTANPMPTGDIASQITYKWEITSGTGYATLSATSGESVSIIGNNTTNQNKSVTVKVTASYEKNSVSGTKTITVLAKGSTSSEALTGVSISGSSKIEAAGNGTLTATPTCTSDVTSQITYNWVITSGSEYATLSATSGKSVTIRGNNTTNQDKNVTVKVTASYNSTTVTNTHTFTVAAVGIPVENRLTDLELVPFASIVACDGQILLAPKVTYTGTLAESDFTSDWQITSGNEYAELIAPINRARDVLTFTGSNTRILKANNTTDSQQTVKVSVTVSAGEVSLTESCTVTIKAVGDVSNADLIVIPGANVKTYGWADLANNGAGMSYPNTTNIIYIGDDGYKDGSGSLTSYTSSMTKRKVFTNAIASGSVSSTSVNETAAIIILSGTVDLSDGKVSDNDHNYFKEFDSSTHKRKHGDIKYEIGSNKAIIGVKGARVAFGGLVIYANGGERGNIIIQNIDFWDAHGSTEEDTAHNKDSKASADSLILESNGTSTVGGYTVYNHVPKNIWIDHCKFSDGTCVDLERNYNHDGSLDMKAGQFVTVSYCEFTNHDKVTLLAPNDDYVDPEQRQITFHHNYYHGAIQRMPRSRGCKVHLYNNYYDNIGINGNGGYSLGPGIGSQYIVENNYFGTHQGKVFVKYFDSSASTSATTFSKLYHNGNNVTFSSSNMAKDSAEKASPNDVTKHLVSNAPWTIRYEYESKMSANSELPVLISAEAGADKLKSVEVNSVSY